MPWGVREWAVTAGADWTVHLSPDRADELKATIELMLVNGRSQLYLYFGGGVVAAPEPQKPVSLTFKRPARFDYELSTMSGGNTKRGRLEALLPWIEEQLEREGGAVLIADQRDITDLQATLALETAPLGRRARTSPLAS